MSHVTHPLLQEQIAEAGVLNYLNDSQFLSLIKAVCGTYTTFENEIKKLLDANEISSQEMEEAISEIKKSAEQSEKTARFKSDFLANMSHEIRTPINGILGLCEMIRENEQHPDNAQLLDLLNKSARGLLTVVNEVLDISKIEAGKLTITPRNTNIRTLFSDMGMLYAAAARDKKLEILTVIDDSIPPLIFIDDGRLLQIVTNLLGNAVKFTPDLGGIILNITTGSTQDNRKAIIISVADSGIGIPKEYLDNIFTPFTQADASIARTYGGTGLGLTITEKLSKLMGGEIMGKSHLGVGTLFQVVLPYTEVDETAIDPEYVTKSKRVPCTALQGLKVLVAEDNHVNQKIVVHNLEKLGCQVQVASSGRQALDQYQKSPFDLILMDCQMPEMSGFEASNMIREQFHDHTIPIIALTALAMEGDRERCLDSGMNDYLSKPFKTTELKDVLLKWIAKPKQ